MLQNVTKLRANNKLKLYAAFFKIKVNNLAYQEICQMTMRQRDPSITKWAETRQKHKGSANEQAREYSQPE